MQHLDFTISVALACMTLFSACNEPPPKRPSVRGLLDPGDWATRVANENARVLEQRYLGERQFNLGGPIDQPPLRGLALSGGGVRSGSFCVGVLAALHEIGALCRMDLMSSVSGGGYAASWLYTQALANGFDVDALFRPDGKYQQYLTNHGEIVSHFSASSTWLRRSEYGFNAIITLAWLPVNLFANGLFGWHANVAPMRRFYQNGLDRVYHSIPDDSGGSRAAPHLELADLCRIKGRLPLPIVNTAAHVEAATGDAAGLLRNRVFEFTPLGYGSDYFGYHGAPFPLDYSTSIAVSGAAADSKELREPNAQMLASVLNTDLGYFIDNPESHSSILRRALPWPLYLFSGHYQRDYYGDRIYLTDGGAAENLGAYALVRRLCRYMLIVDAEYDPNHEFGAYWILKNALLAEMGVDLSVDEVDRGAFSDQRPIMFGTIRYFPTLDPASKKLNSMDIKVVYLKMSVDRKRLDAYGRDVRDYATAYADFPQRTTLDQSYTPDQFLAYRELGKYIVKSHRQQILQGLALD